MKTTLKIAAAILLLATLTTGEQNLFADNGDPALSPGYSAPIKGTTTNLPPGATDKPLPGMTTNPPMAQPPNPPKGAPQ